MPFINQTITVRIVFFKLIVHCFLLPPPLPPPHTHTLETIWGTVKGIKCLKSDDQKKRVSFLVSIFLKSQNKGRGQDVFIYYKEDTEGR